MHDLMPEYSRELCLRAKLGQQTTIDGDFAAGQRPGIWHRVIQYDEFVGQLAIADRRQPVSDILHVLRQRRVYIVATALGLLRWRIGLRPHLQLLGLADDHEVGIAGHRIHRAAGYYYGKYRPYKDFPKH